MKKMSENSTIEELLKFPCPFAIKIMGFNQPELIAEVRTIIIKYAEDFNHEKDLQYKLSRAGNYLSITATVNATSKAQLDNIYLALNKHPLVKITL